MTSSTHLVNLLLTLLILQITNECFASYPYPHPFANIYFTPKEDYCNPYGGLPQSTYNVPFPGGVLRVGNFGPPPPGPPTTLPTPPKQSAPPPPGPAHPPPASLPTPVTPPTKYFIQDVPPPPPPRFFIQDPIREPNCIPDGDDRNCQKNPFKPPNDHFLHKRETLIRPKVVQRPASLRRHKLSTPKKLAVPATQCNCNKGGLF